MSDTRDDYIGLVNNLNYFFDKVLYAAQCEGNWSVESIEQGIGWALYCEKALEEPNMKCSVSSYLLAKSSSQNFSLEDICCLRKLLISNLFINQLLSKDVLTALYGISIREFGSCITQQIVNSSITKVNNYHLAISALQNKDEDKNYNILKIRLLIEAANNSSVPLSSLNHLLVNKDSLEMLLELAENLQEQEKVKMMMCLGEWFRSELEKDNFLLFQHISFLSMNQLEKICQTFQGIQYKLLSFLKTLGNNLCDDEKCKDTDKYKSILALSSTFLKSSKLNHILMAAFSSWFLTKEAFFWHELFAKATS